MRCEFNGDEVVNRESGCVRMELGTKSREVQKVQVPHSESL